MGKPQNNMGDFDQDWNVSGFGCAPCLYGQTSDIIEGEGSCMMATLQAWLCGICTVCCYAPKRRETLRGYLFLKQDQRCCLRGSSSPACLSSHGLTASRFESTRCGAARAAAANSASIARIARMRS